MVEKQIDKNIKALRSDRGGEYITSKFLDHLKEKKFFLNGYILIHHS